MLDWKIIAVDNGKQVYTAEHKETGHKVQIEVPEEHKGVVTAQAYVSAILDAHSHAIANPAKKPGFFSKLFRKK